MVTAALLSKKGLRRAPADLVVGFRVCASAGRERIATILDAGIGNCQVHQTFRTQVTRSAVADPIGGDKGSPGIRRLAVGVVAEAQSSGAVPTSTSTTKTGSDSPFSKRSCTGVQVCGMPFKVPTSVIDGDRVRWQRSA